MQSIANTNQQRKTPTAATWRALLHERGLSDATLARAGIRPNGRGWLYPVAPGVTARRWKAYPNQGGPKYLWRPEQPATARFYDPVGDLAEHVAAAGGVLLLAAGEPDTWALWEAGLFNASCTLAGEGTIPPWMIDALHRLAVRVLRYWPDCDPAGRPGRLSGDRPGRAGRRR